ncbi:MAG: hypothetical protein QOJ54_1733 [Aliidongia sp.]|jgi:hypothetical protein|nr:hypothetical protein [Aliidongia sp.]
MAGTMSLDATRRLDFALGHSKRPKTLRCGWCKAKIAVAPRGRLPDFCCHGCRQRAYEKRKWAPPPWAAPLARDLAEAAAPRLRRAELSEARTVRALDDELRRKGIFGKPKPSD